MALRSGRRKIAGRCHFPFPVCAFSILGEHMGIPWHRNSYDILSFDTCVLLRQLAVHYFLIYTQTGIYIINLTLFLFFLFYLRAQIRVVNAFRLGLERREPSLAGPSAARLREISRQLQLQHSQRSHTTSPTSPPPTGQPAPTKATLAAAAAFGGGKTASTSV